MTSRQERQIRRNVVRATESALQNLGLTRDEAWSLLDKHREISAILLEEFRRLSKTDKYPVRIDYRKSVEDVVESGFYHWRSGYITSSHFSVFGTGVVEVNLELVYLNKEVDSDVAIAYLESSGLRPATLMELLVFGVTYPNVQTQFPVAALGSIWTDSHGNCHAAYLGLLDKKRSLHVLGITKKWFQNTRFLVVRKSTNMV